MFPVSVVIAAVNRNKSNTNAAALVTVVAVASAHVTAVMYDGLAGLPAFNPDDDGDRVPREVAGQGAQDALAAVVSNRGRLATRSMARRS